MGSCPELTEGNDAVQRLLYSGHLIEFYARGKRGRIC